MFKKMIFVLFAVVAIVAAAPAPEAKADAKADAKPLFVAAAPVAYSAPLVRNYNGLAVSAPLVAAASPYAAYSAYSPYVAYPSAYAGYPSAAYVASPYAASVFV